MSHILRMPEPSLAQPTIDALSPHHRSVLVAAHRGAWHQAPENSVAAIEAAIALGADIVECDVQATRDEVLVLLHDSTLDRMTSLSGPVAEADWSDLRKAHLREQAGGSLAAFSEHRPSTLAEALCCARGRIIVNIDIKSAQLADRVALAIITAGMADQVFLKAFVNGPADLKRLRRSPFFGRVPFVPMLKAAPGSLRATLESLRPWGFPMYEVEFTDLADLEQARSELQRQGARLWVNTIGVSHSLDFCDQRALHEPDAVWGQLLDVGVGAIQTDATASLLAYLRHLGRH